METGVGDFFADGGGGASVQQISGYSKGFGLVGWWYRGLQKEGSDGIIQGAEDAFGFTVLRRCMWAGATQQDALGSEEGGDGVVHELRAVVRLKTFDREAKLRVRISNELK